MVALLVAFLLLALVFSFLCSMWEAVLLSVTPSYARLKKREGGRTGRLLAHMKREIDRPLIAILTLNTIAHTVGAIGVGEQAALIWAETNPLITRLVVPAGMTLAILILSEIIPKTLGANYWRELAPFTVRSLRVLILILYPVVVVSQRITAAFKRDGGRSMMSRRDLLALAELGAEEGVVGSGESRLIANLLEFRDIRAGDIATPRTVVHAAPEEQTLADYHREHPEVRFSRVPLFAEADREHVTGFVLRNEVLAALVAGDGDRPLSSLKREIMVLNDRFKLTRVFERLIADTEHIALVVDEFDGVVGILTLEDVIETLLGLEIVDESDLTVNMRTLAHRHRDRRVRSRGSDGS